jgi:tRNA(Ile)-lysidine synthetase-like protein
MLPPVSGSILNRIRQLQHDQRLFVPGTVVVAVSGGADSLTLLHTLLHLRDEISVRLHVATLDHGLRGPAGTADAQYVSEVAMAWQLPFTAERIDLPAQMATRQPDQTTNVEAAARQARYAFLARVAAQIGATMIATGHTLDDQAETILMHLLRGTGLAGLRGMRPMTPLAALNLGLPSSVDGLTLVRPLLTTPRLEIDAYCAERLHPAGIKPRTDATNADLSLMRNRIRHEVMPVLTSIAPAFREALGRMALSVGDDYAALRTVLPALEPMRGATEAAAGSISLEAFRALPIAFQRQLLLQTRQQLFPTDTDGWGFAEATKAQAFLATVRTPTTYDGWIHLHDGRLYFAHALPYPDGVPQLAPATVLRFSTAEPSVLLPMGWRLLITRITDAGKTQPPATDELRAVLHIPAGAKLELRTVRRGERFKPAGLGGKSQKISDLLINLKVPSAWRPHAPTLVVNEEVAWIVAPLIGGFKSRLASSFVHEEGDVVRNNGEIVQFTYDYVIS